MTAESPAPVRHARATLTLPAIALRQNGYRIYLTGIKAEDLEDFTRIDHYDPALDPDDPKQGYQRREETPRIKKLGNWLRRNDDFHQPVRY